VIVGQGLDKQSTFSSNAAGGQSTAGYGVPGNPFRQDCSQRHAENACLKRTCMVAAPVMEFVIADYYVNSQ